MKYFFASVLLFIGSQSFAWGGRGHDTICQTAVYLVKNQTLKDFLRNKPNMMGHLCNIPDIYWKSMPSEKTKLGNPTHYINPEIIGFKAKDMPLDLTALVQKYTGTDNKIKENTKIMSLPQEMGTNWWRANQLYTMAVVEGKKLQGLTAPANSKEEQDDNLPFNKYLYDMLTYMGLMGHFVGDDGQPFHSNTDHDGYIAGHGGIHAYYEDLAVSYFDANLSDLIAKQARVIEKDSKLNKFMKEKTVLEKMRALGALSESEVAAVFKVDPIITKSETKEEKGMTIKTPAKRQGADVGQKRFSKLIVNQMARSALLLAGLWDDIYSEIGKPEFKAYKSYRYPLSPDFIVPDYYEIKAPETKTSK